MRTFCGRVSGLRVLMMVSATGVGTCALAQSSTPVFTAGNVVVLVEGCGVQGGTCTNVPNSTGNGTLNSSSGGYGDNQASPVTLFQFTPTFGANGPTGASFVNSLVLPQTQTNANLPLASEYGSSSEGTLQLSGGGQYLTFGEYGINANTYNAAPQAMYGTSVSPIALAQSGSLTGQSYTPIARTIVLVDPYGNANSSTALYNIFNTNNPRSVYTQDGLSVYVSGQGAGSDQTAGVFLTPLFGVNNSPTAITGADTTSKTLSQDTRTVQIYNGTLYVSTDTKGGSNSARSFVGTLGKPPATGVYNSNSGPTQLTSSNNGSPSTAITSTGKLVLTASEANNVNTSVVGTGKTVNLSPSNYFFANAYTMYIADTGNGKQTSGDYTYGAGGLQKWVNTATDGSGAWQLVYTISAGLNLVANTSGSGVSGLYGLTGVVSGANVNLYATSATLNDLDTTYLYGFQDVLAATTKPTTSFQVLATAPSDSNFKGVAMAPSLPAGSATVLSKPLGLTITVAGAGCSAGTFVTPVTLTWTPGSSCQLTTTATQMSGTSSYTFGQWQDGTTATTDTVTAPATSAVYTATFADNTTTAVNSLASSNATVGDTVSLMATVMDTANVSTPPAGNVTFTTTVNGASHTAGTAPVTNGVATLSYSVTYGGSNVITAAFTPTNSASYTASTDGTGKTLTVAQAALTPVSGYAPSMVQGTTTPLNLILGYPGTVAPAGTITYTVNGSTAGLGTPSCIYKVKHFNCAYSYTSTLAPGNYTIAFSQAADSNYTAVNGSYILTVTPAPMNSLRGTSGSIGVVGVSSATAAAALK